jgi:putative addiction module component (TIGR02574 family)
LFGELSGGTIWRISKFSMADVLELSVPERIQLVEDIWDSIAAVPQSVPLTQVQRDELDRRLEAYRENPEDGSPWEEVKSRILGIR